MEQELSNLLKDLATELGTTVEFLWAVLLKQAQVEVILNGILILVTIMACLGSFYYFRWLNKKWEDISYNDNDLWHIFISVFLGVFIICLIVFSAIGIYSMVTALMNPEYWALDKILQKL
jgi:hypothetical protein